MKANTVDPILCFTSENFMKVRNFGKFFALPEKKIFFAITCSIVVSVGYMVEGGERCAQRENIFHRLL